MATKENQIEKEFIQKLEDLKYVYRDDIHDRNALEFNFRQKFEALNRVKLTDNEFQKLLTQIITPDVFNSSKILREKNSFEREDGTPLHYTLVNIKDWCKNSFEVINQLRINTQNSHHRYDVILLINGLPLVQIELKTLGVNPRRAMQQIVEYKNDVGNGYANSLLCFMQLFIVSNKINTYYFANNDTKHFAFDVEERFLPIYQYADKNNKKITHLDDFTKRFLPKCKLGETISRYMVLVQCEQKLMMMRPYQVYAVEAIVKCIEENRGNGYIWHTTGSGKTLTSFKASTLLKDNPKIEKCLFVVDRKDLDKQTREEFNKFQEKCVEENTNTQTLVNRLLSSDYADKVIVTTIQKLGLALDDTNQHNYKKRLEILQDKRVVFIFDECHRSQFGENHKAIKEFFPNAQLFGFTGTPIFEQNATYQQIDGDIASLKTTKDIFEKELHAYTITNAIDDGNVLRFHIDYFKPDDETNTNSNATISKKAVVKSILDKHYSATNNKRFNAIFATASINNAIEYYKLFKKLQQKKIIENDDYKPLNITCVFSPPAEGNKDIAQLQEDLPTEKADNKKDPRFKKKALKEIIADYNFQFKTNHDFNNFDVYYQGVQNRIKNHKFPDSDLPHNQKIDIIIVVDMLLTGFDAKYLNTLYVDKNLKHHGLIQAFSRTNRVLNNTKPYGNILDFRLQQNQVDDAIALFSGKHTKPPKEIWIVDSAPKVIEKFEAANQKLDNFMAFNHLENKPDQITNLKGDEARAEFINTFKEVQRLKTQLDQYTELSAKQKEKIDDIIKPDDLKAFRGAYLETAQNLKKQQVKNPDSSSIIDELDFEFILFASTIIDYDYIMKLIAKYCQSEPKKQKMNKEQLISLLKSDANLSGEQEDMTDYINSLEVGKGLDELAIKNGYNAFKNKKNTNRLKKIAENHKLSFKNLQEFVDNVLERMIFDGELLTDLFEPLDLGWKARREKELSFMEELSPLLKKLGNDRNISGLEAYDE